MQIETETRHRSRPAHPRPATPSRLVLTIDRTAYVVVSLHLALDPGRRAHRLIKPDGTAYDLAETRWGPQCDCPDFVFRRDGLDPAGCKHIKGLVRHGLIAGRGSGLVSTLPQQQSRLR